MSSRNGWGGFPKYVISKLAQCDPAGNLDQPSAIPNNTKASFEILKFIGKLFKARTGEAESRYSQQYPQVVVPQQTQDYAMK